MFSKLAAMASEYAIDAKACRHVDASSIKMNEKNTLERVFAIAPMMDGAG
jgi:hypothetical protein